MPYQLFSKSVVSSFLIFSINCGDWGIMVFLGRDVYLGIEKAGAGGKGRKRG
jgi:hypothetical protein